MFAKTLNLFETDVGGRTALDWARIRKNELEISILSEAMEKEILDARAALVAHADSVDNSHTRLANQKQAYILKKFVTEKDDPRILEAINTTSLSRQVGTPGVRLNYF